MKGTISIILVLVAVVVLLCLVSVKLASPEYALKPSNTEVTDLVIYQEMVIDSETVLDFGIKLKPTGLAVADDTSYAKSEIISFDDEEIGRKYAEKKLEADFATDFIHTLPLILKGAGWFCFLVLLGYGGATVMKTKWGRRQG